jgi:hypothetical protein
MKIFLVSIFILSGIVKGSSQNITLDSLKKQKLFGVSGGLNITGTNYAGNSLMGREKFNYYASGNINFSFLDISLPVSFNYSNRKFSYSYTQPFNQFSLHPSYRWVQAHLGWCSTSFSPYSLSGHSYYGTGLNLKIPKVNLNLTAMYGRLLKAIEPDTLNAIVGTDTSKNVISPIFKRMAYGAKLEFAKKGGTISFSYFKAYDNKNSLKKETGNYSIFPENNNVITLGVSTNISKHLKLIGEAGTSIIKKDIIQKRVIKFDRDVAYFVDSLIRSKFRYNAVKLNLSYSIPKTFSSFGFGYERIDPGYRTLGSYFFNNDLENITINFGQQILKGKIGITGSIGIQKDDLKKLKANQTKRLLNSYSLNIVPTSKININASYSNFTTYSYIKDQFQEITSLTPNNNWDTLSRYAQVAQSANAGVMYMLSSNKNGSQHINMNVSFSDTKEIMGSIIKGTAAAKIYNANVGYNISLAQIKTKITVAGNYMLNRYLIGSAEATGATLVITKPVFPIHLPLSISASYNTTKQAAVRSGGVFNMRFNTNYSIMKKHNLSLSIVALMRKSAGNNGQPPKTVYESTSQIAYSYSF